MKEVWGIFIALLGAGALWIYELLLQKKQLEKKAIVDEVKKEEAETVVLVKGMSNEDLDSTIADELRRHGNGD